MSEKLRIWKKGLKNTTVVEGELYIFAYSTELSYYALVMALETADESPQTMAKFSCADPYFADFVGWTIPEDSPYLLTMPLSTIYRYDAVVDEVNVGLDRATQIYPLANPSLTHGRYGITNGCNYYPANGGQPPNCIPVGYPVKTNSRPNTP